MSSFEDLATLVFAAALLCPRYAASIKPMLSALNIAYDCLFSLTYDVLNLKYIEHHDGILFSTSRLHEIAKLIFCLSFIDGIIHPF